MNTVIQTESPTGRRNTGWITTNAVLDQADRVSRYHSGPKFVHVGTERHLARTNVDGDIVGLNSTLWNPASLSHAR